MVWCKWHTFVKRELADTYSKTCVTLPLSKRPKMVFKTDYGLMQVKSIAECSKGKHSAILLTFIKLPVVIKTFVLSIFEWPFHTGFTVLHKESFPYMYTYFIKNKPADNR